MMRIAAVLAMPMAAAACISTGEYVITERAVLPVEQAIGLTRAELAQRLGMNPPVGRLAKIAALENGILVEVVPNSYNNSKGACPNGGLISMEWRYEGQAGPYTRDSRRLAPPALYRDGRYAGPAEDPQRPGDDASQPAYIVTTCTEARKSLNPGAVALLPLVPVAAGIIAADNASQPRPDDVNPTLATLRLGSPPPGGLDAWLAKLPKGARIKSREGMGAEVSLGDSHLERVRVMFENGMVTRLESAALTDCELTTEHTFRCDYKSMPVR